MGTKVKSTITGDRLAAFLIESNTIEGIVSTSIRAPLVVAAMSFLGLEIVRVSDLENLVRHIQPGARLRDRAGLDVQIGNHIPIAGGPEVVKSLQELLAYIHLNDMTPFAAHQSYKEIHPFTDGNGRSGRLLWLWHSLRSEDNPFRHDLSFLHQWYYTSLSAK